jgi:hypothetical protein
VEEPALDRGAVLVGGVGAGGAFMFPRVQKVEMLYNISTLEAPTRPTGGGKARSQYHDGGTGSLEHKETHGHIVEQSILESKDLEQISCSIWLGSSPLLVVPSVQAVSLCSLGYT